jgi:hypothetical protein
MSSDCLNKVVNCPHMSSRKIEDSIQERIMEAMTCRTELSDEIAELDPGEEKPNRFEAVLVVNRT